MTTSKDTKVIGIGMYLEMRRLYASTPYTTQFIMFPEIEATTHTLVLARRLSPSQMKRTWSRYSSPTSIANAVRDTSTMDEAIEKVSAFAVKMLGRLVVNEYSLVGDPIFFEITPEDASALALAKTPYKVIGRINKARKKMGFPEKLVDVSSASF